MHQIPPQSYYLLIAVLMMPLFSNPAAASEPDYRPPHPWNPDHWIPWEMVVVADEDGEPTHTNLTAAGDSLVACSTFVSGAESRIIANRSTDKGLTWSPSNPVVTMSGSADLVPAALWWDKRGGVTLIAAVLSSGDGQVTKADLRRFVSKDKGQTWSELPVMVNRGWRWVIPGRRAISVGGRLLLPCWGVAEQDSATRPQTVVAILSSTDSGATWSTFTMPSDLGPNTSYSYPDLVRLSDSRILCFAQHNTRHPDGLQTTGIIKTSFNTKDLSWSKPQPCLAGREPTVEKLPTGEIAVGTSNRMVLWYTLSKDLGKSWSAEIPIRGVLPEYHVPKYQGGWQTAVVNKDTVVGAILWGPEGSDGKPRKKAAVMACILRRKVDYPSGLPPKLSAKSWYPQPPKTSDPHSWIPSERINIPGASSTLAVFRTADGTLMAGTTGSGDAGNRLLRSIDGGREWEDIGMLPFRPSYFTALRSGRIIAFSIQDIVYGNHQLQAVGHLTVGRTLWQHTGYSQQGKTFMWISDDGGVTWTRQEKPIDIGVPYFIPCQSGPFELPDGTIVMPWEGFATDKEAYNVLWSAGLVRSRDGGRTWGDISYIGRGSFETRLAPNEAALQILPDGTWICVTRTDWQGWGGDDPVMMTIRRNYSRDQGYTWTTPEPVFLGQEGTVAVLGDGTLFCSYRQFGGHVYWLSADYGKTWVYQGDTTELVGASGMVEVFPLDKDSALAYCTSTTDWSYYPAGRPGDAVILKRKSR